MVLELFEVYDSDGITLSDDLAGDSVFGQHAERHLRPHPRKAVDQNVLLALQLADPRLQLGQGNQRCVLDHSSAAPLTRVPHI